MNVSPFLRRLLFSVVAVVALVSVYGATLSPHALAHPAKPTKGWDASQLVDVRPLWTYAHKITARQAPIPPCLTNAVPPRCYSPQQIRRAYSVQKLLNEGITGGGRTVVLVDFSSSPTLAADVHLYDQLYGLKDPTINVIAPYGMPPLNVSFYAETALDIETVHSLAPDATIDLVLADVSQAPIPEDAIAIALRATKYAVDNDLGDVISQSYGVGESCVGAAYIQAELQVFAEARQKNITVLAADGDSGDLTSVCQGTQITVGKGVSVPSSDPYVTAVGGTTLDADVNTGTYIGETTWNEWNIGGGATGGGFSILFARPSYQDGIPGIGATRGVPDVAFDADPLTGVPIVLSENGTTFIVPVGGTSVGSPAWAAFVALANQAAGERLGFLNDSIYKLIQSNYYEKGFHDITTGDNSTLINDNTGKPMPVPGYSAKPGWDAVTGAGTPKVSSLISWASS